MFDETLENRVLLHATLVGGVLTATGLNGVNNNISLSQAVIAGVTVIQVLHSTSPATAGHPITQTFPSGAVVRIVVNGGDKNDSLSISPAITKPSIMNGNAGNDAISGGGGLDVINGGSGADNLRGNNGNDQLNGGNDADNLFGLLGADRLSGGIGVDAAFYTEKIINLTLSIDNVANDAGEGDNILTDVENVFSGSGADKITGSAANNLLDGGAGNDTMDGAGGNDKLQGNAGNDRMLAGTGADDYNGGGGNDTVDYSARAVPLNISINNVANDGAAGEVDNVHTDVENVFGGSAGDTISGSPFDNRLFGGPGNDIIRGGAGDDVLIGGLGNDQLFGEDGDDIFLTKEGLADVLNGGNGFDVASADAGDAKVSIELLV
jgi:Ca2+-binding RTX toxin-like protein